MVQAGPLESFSWDTTGGKLYFVGFTWQNFGSGVATGVSSVRRYQKLPSCWTEPMPASSNKDPLLRPSAMVVVPP